MNRQARSLEFFGVEAAEYLRILSEELTAAQQPDSERLMRTCRTLRGAALMAGLGTYARAAAALELRARRVRNHEIGWDGQERRQWREGVARLVRLAGRAAHWNDDDDREALALAGSIELDVDVTGSGAAGSRPPGLTPGVRAFIARESAAIAGAWHEAARALAPTPPPAALNAVLDRMRSLRGLDAAAASLSPLPELLEAMEITARGLLGGGTVNPGVADIFADAADALRQMAASVSETGRVTVPEGLDGIARRLLARAVSEDDVVAIESLAPDGETAIVRTGSLPSPEAVPVPIELAGVGDHLISQAELLDRTASPAAAAFRLYILHSTLDSMPLRSPTGRFLAPVSRMVMATIGTPGSTGEPAAIAALLRTCGDFLVNAADQRDPRLLLASRDELVARLSPETGTEGITADDDIVPIGQLAPDLPADDEDGIVPIESLAPDDSDLGEIVPIELLLMDEPPAPVIPHHAPGEPGRLETAFGRLAAVAADAPPEPPSLAALAGDPVTDIRAICYSGSSAIERAAAVRVELLAALDTGIDLGAVRPLLDEMMDLIELARDAA